MARRKHPPIDGADRELIGTLLRDLRRSAGYRSVEAAATRAGCPASRQTIYAYERGGLVPSLSQYLDLVEFYVMKTPAQREARPAAELRAQGTAAVSHALTLSAYAVPRAIDLITRMRPSR